MIMMPNTFIRMPTPALYSIFRSPPRNHGRASPEVAYNNGAWYNPNTGRYGNAVVAYGPYGAAGSAAVYNPQTGTYARGQAVWDSNEFESLCRFRK